MRSLLEKKQGFAVCRQTVVNNPIELPGSKKPPFAACVRGMNVFNYQHVREDGQSCHTS